MKYEVNLQGSYKNDTNIFARKRDVLVELTSAIHHNSTRLTEREQAHFRLKRQTPPRVTYGQFREMVSQALHDRFGWNSVRETPSGKAFKVTTPYRAADVVVCHTFFDYLTYPIAGYGLPARVKGVVFYAPVAQRWIVNYPQLHYLGGVAKNKRTTGRFKRTVRLFKNLRAELVDRGSISEDLATSYFIECLIYNCGDPCFRASLSETLGRIVMDLFQAYFSGRWTAFRCLNEQLPLFGNSPEQWSLDKAIAFWTALVRYWGG